MFSLKMVWWQFCWWIFEALELNAMPLGMNIHGYDMGLIIRDKACQPLDFAVDFAHHIFEFCSKILTLKPENNRIRGWVAMHQKERNLIKRASVGIKEKKIDGARCKADHESQSYQKQ